MRRGKFPIVVVLIISILVAGGARRWAQAARTGSSTSSTSNNLGNLGQMNSFALALLLGGLRGPLVMFLWPSAERQKNERNLEDFDTKIEWIRLLQAEFDTVHIFQIWNKAYNISAQMTNIGNKYRTVLDALDYARNVDAERPNDINILDAIAQLFGDKFGTSTERVYYRQRVRDESQARQPMVRVTLPSPKRDQLTDAAENAGLTPSRLRFSGDQSGETISATIPQTVARTIQAALPDSEFKYADVLNTRPNRNDPRWRRLEMDPLLDDKGNLLPQLYAPKLTRPADLPASSEWNDGSDLQYLKQFEPYPYGVSTLALGYNYFKRSQVLQSVNKQKHAQRSETVLDSRPALALRDWSGEEWERGRRAEIEAFGRKVPAERNDMETTIADLPLDSPVRHRALIDEAIYSYGRAEQIAVASLAEYNRHLSVYKTNLYLYIPHMNDLEAERQLVNADRDYLRAMTTADSAPFKASAAAYYREAIRQYEIIVLRYYVPDALVSGLYPPGVTKGNIADARLAPADLDRLYQSINAIAQARPRDFDTYDELTEYVQYITRSAARLGKLAP